MFRSHSLKEADPTVGRQASKDSRAIPPGCQHSLFDSLVLHQVSNWKPRSKLHDRALTLSVRLDREVGKLAKLLQTRGRTRISPYFRLHLKILNREAGPQEKQWPGVCMKAMVVMAHQLRNLVQQDSPSDIQVRRTNKVSVLLYSCTPQLTICEQHTTHNQATHMRRCSAERGNNRQRKAIRTQAGRSYGQVQHRGPSYQNPICSLMVSLDLACARDC